MAHLQKFFLITAYCHIDLKMLTLFPLTGGICVSYSETHLALH